MQLTSTVVNICANASIQNNLTQSKQKRTRFLKIPTFSALVTQGNPFLWRRKVLGLRDINGLILIQSIKLNFHLSSSKTTLPPNPQ